MRIAITLALVGCVHSPISTMDRADLARSLYDRAHEAAVQGLPGRALGFLLALHAPQLADVAPPEAIALENELIALRCATRPGTFVVEPPIEDEHDEYRFDGAYWSDELEAYRVPPRWNCDN